MANLTCSQIHEAMFKDESSFFSILRLQCKKNPTEKQAANIEEVAAK